MATMVSELVAETFAFVQGSAREALNTLAVQKLLTDPVATFTFPLAGIQIGGTIEIGWVEYSVVDLNVALKTVTTIPVIEGTAVTHPVGTRVRIRPRYSTGRIIRAMNDDLSVLSANGVYKLKVVAAVNGVVAPPLDSLAVLDVRSTDKKELVPQCYRITDLPGGTMELRGDAVLAHAVFACTLNPFDTVADSDVALSGLVTTAYDLPPMGTAIRLLAGAEAQRNLSDTQGDTRRAEEVPAGAMSGALRNFAAIRQARMVEEAHRIQQRYGFRKAMSI